MWKSSQLHGKTVVWRTGVRKPGNTWICELAIVIWLNNCCQSILPFCTIEPGHNALAEDIHVYLLSVHLSLSDRTHNGNDVDFCFRGCMFEYGHGQSFFRLIDKCHWYLHWRFLTPLQKTPFENNVTKGEIRLFWAISLFALMVSILFSYFTFIYEICLDVFKVCCMWKRVKVYVGR